MSLRLSLRRRRKIVVQLLEDLSVSARSLCEEVESV